MLMGMKNLIEITGEKEFEPGKKCFETKDGLIDLIEIRTKDLASANEQELEFDRMKFTKLYRVYGGDLKIIALNYPCNTIEQQKYFRNKLRNARSEIKQRYLKIQLDALEEIGKTRTRREYYLMLFSPDVESHRKNRMLVRNCLSDDYYGLMRELDWDKKKQIIYKLCNKSSALWS